MPAKAYRGVADRIDISSAAAPVTASTPVVEDGWAGVPITSAAVGEPYTMHVDGEFEFNFIATAAVGSLVYITAADGTLTIAPASGRRPFGKVTRVQGELGVATGKMWVRVSPFTYAVTA